MITHSREAIEARAEDLFRRSMAKYDLPPEVVLYVKAGFDRGFALGLVMGLKDGLEMGKAGLEMVHKEISERVDKDLGELLEGK
jgi:hypothetical protein